MTRITWIIIVLIVLSICVTCLEVLLRFAILKSRGNVGAGHVGGVEGQMAQAYGGDRRGLKGLSPPAYAGPSLLVARTLVWVGGSVKGLFV